MRTAHVRFCGSRGGQPPRLPDAAVPLTDRPRGATHASTTTYHQAQPTPNDPVTTPETGCVIHARISDKDSETRHADWSRRPSCGAANAQPSTPLPTQLWP
jgi:hypothetical protein